MRNWQQLVPVTDNFAISLDFEIGTLLRRRDGATLTDRRDFRR